MNSTDYAMLRGDRVVDQMIKATGKTVEELQGIDRAESQLAGIRLNALELSYPEPQGVGIRETERGVASRAYLARRSISGKGFTAEKVSIAYTILTSIGIRGDRLWFHVSITRHDDKMPTYDDLCWLKDSFIGSDRASIQVFPKRDEHVSDHPRCLHLWTCLEDGFELPDFRMFGTI